MKSKSKEKTLQKILNELKASFKPYEAFWAEWKEKQENHLDLVEKSSIEVHLKYKFLLNNSQSLMRCDKDEQALELIVSKLNARKFIFNQWLVTQFKANLNTLAKPMGRKQFYETPISELVIPNSLKKILLNLNHHNLIRYYNNRNLHELLKEDTFKIIKIFCLAFKRHSNGETIKTKQMLVLTA